MAGWFLASTGTLSVGLTVDVVGRGSSFGLTPDELIPSREAKLHCILNYFCRVMSVLEGMDAEAGAGVHGVAGGVLSAPAF